MRLEYDTLKKDKYDINLIIHGLHEFFRLITGYIIGATNVLFKQKKGVADVIVDLEKDRVEIPDPDLQKALKFSTEDLRFVSNIVRHVTSSPTSSSDHLKQAEGEKKHEIFSDGVSWEGGDEWCRSQFRFYLLCKSGFFCNIKNSYQLHLSDQRSVILHS